MEDLFLKALPLLRELKKHGRQAYFVGGSVRDAQMNRDIGDIEKEILHCHTPRLLIVDKFLHIAR